MYPITEMILMPEMTEVRESSWVAEFQKYFLACMTVIGIITNSLSFVLVMRKRFRRTTIGVYLATLAVFDTLSLIVIFILALETEPLSYKTSSYSDALCKILNVGAYVFIPISAYVIAVLSCERCYVTANPYKPKPTHKHAIICVCIVIAVISICYSPIAIVMYGLNPVPTHVHNIATQKPEHSFNGSTLGSLVPTNLAPTDFICNPLPNYQWNVDNYVVVFDLVVACFIPYVTITVANVVLIVTLLKQRAQIQPQNAMHQVVNNVQAKNKKERHVTRMLITASLFYLCSTLPLSLYVCIVSITLATFDNPVWVVLLDLYVLNFSLNFFVYVVSGRTLRMELKKLLNVPWLLPIDTSQSGV